MFVNTSPQWTELGERLCGPDSEHTRIEILQKFLGLEKSILEQSHSDVPYDRLQALMEAVQIAKSLCESVLKPVDLSNL